MATVEKRKISQLTADTSIDGNEIVAVSQGGTTVRITVQQIADFVIAQLGQETLAGVTGFSGTTANGHSLLTWDEHPDATGYIVTQDGELIYTGPLLQFDATGLTNGTAYDFAIVPTAAGYNNGPAITISVTPTGGVVYTPVGRYIISGSAGMPTEEEILAGTPFTITAGQDYAVTFGSTGWLKVFESIEEPVKTKNVDPVFGPDNFGPDGTFSVGATVGAFRGYLSNYQTGNSTLNFNQ